MPTVLKDSQGFSRNREDDRKFHKTSDISILIQGKGIFLQLTQTLTLKKLSRVIEFINGKQGKNATFKE